MTNWNPGQKSKAQKSKKDYVETYKRAVMSGATTSKAMKDYAHGHTIRRRPIEFSSRKQVTIPNRDTATFGQPTV
jgi:hypothetical protein